jgi:sulfate adenylyltransferase
MQLTFEGVSENEKSPSLISPYGGNLVDLVASEEERAFLIARASVLSSVQLSERAVCDLELLATGAFSPLDRFMGRSDYEAVLGQMRLANGVVFPIPICLGVEADAHVKLDSEIALRNSKNEILALMKVEEIFDWKHEEFASRILGTLDKRHPLVAESSQWGKLNISGSLRVIQLPKHFDFQEIRYTPLQNREQLAGRGHKNVVAFQTRNPLHRAHEELTQRAIRKLDAVLLLHPVVGMTKPGDVDHFTRVRSYKALASRYYEKDRIQLSLLSLAMRMAGPREALWHAIIRRNFGASHLIVGRDHASPGLDSNGNPFYGPYDAQELVSRFSEEIGIGVVTFDEMVYLPDEDRYEEASKVPSNARTTTISGSQIRDDYLRLGRKLPAWFTRPEVAEIMSESFPPLHRSGLCIWFTGLSGSGKSTTAEILTSLLMEKGRQVTVLDGDVVRTHLSAGLGFSREDRDMNVRRIGFVASEITRHGGTVICAAISPYATTRNIVRNMVGSDSFVEIFVDTPLELCEQRDTKGLYAKARRGELKQFTGLDDPYEVPANPEVVIETAVNSPEVNARLIISYLAERGLLIRDE